MGLTLDLFDNTKIKNYYISKISYNQTKPFILDIHYAKRMPSISYAYGMYKNNQLVGVVTYGKPPSPALCKGIMGQENAHLILELNRLVLLNNEKNEASILISNSLKLLPKPKIIVSYADTEQNHIGLVYQATNFIYTGLSDKRKEWRMKNSKLHSRTICQTYSLEERKSNQDKFELIDRPRKHRYIYFLGNKTEKKYFKKNLKYQIKPYPKNEQHKPKAL